MKKLQVIAVAPTETKQYAGKVHAGGNDSRSYNNITFAQPLMYVDEEGEVITRTAVKQATQAVFNYNFLDGKLNPLFGQLQVGSKVAGDIVTVPTDEYTIPERRNGQLTGNQVTLSKDTFLVLGDSDSAEWDELVERTRKQRADQRIKQSISAGSVTGTNI